MTKAVNLSGTGVAVLAGVGLLGAFALYAWSKGGASAGIKGAAQGLGEVVGGGAVSLVDGVFSGTVLGVGDSLGIPRTSESECEKATREGRTWDASFACPAGDFLGYVFTGKSVAGSDSDPAPTRTSDAGNSDGGWQWLPNFGWGA